MGDCRLVSVSELPINGCRLYQPQLHREYRGDIWSLYNDTYTDCPKFVEDKASRSYHGVLRGFHGDFKTTKLLSCLQGEVLLAIADARYGSSTFGKTHQLVLSERDRQQVLIPPGVLNAHLCLTSECLFWYKLSSPYDGPYSQVSVRWDDKYLNVDWPVAHPITSRRDRNAMAWSDVDWYGFARGSLANAVRKVAISGYFNPLHSGHLNMIEAAAAIGDRLVVIVNNDRQVVLKGSRPFMDEAERCRVVSMIRGVDEVVLSIDTDRSVCSTLRRVMPDVFANGGDVVSPDQTREAELCNSLGIEMLFNVGGGKTQSSSWILENNTEAS